MCGLCKRKKVVNRQDDFNVQVIVYIKVLFRLTTAMSRQHLFRRRNNKLRAKDMYIQCTHESLLFYVSSVEFDEIIFFDA